MRGNVFHIIVQHSPSLCMHRCQLMVLSELIYDSSDMYLKKEPNINIKTFWLCFVLYYITHFGMINAIWDDENWKIDFFKI